MEQQIDKGIVIRATTKFRNDAMISARENLHLSQFEAANLCGVSSSCYIKLERLCYPRGYPYDKIKNIADVLNLRPEDVMPPELIGKTFPKAYTRRQLVSIQNIGLFCGTPKRFLLPSPSEEIEAKDEIDFVKTAVLMLPKRQQEVIRMKYGLNKDQREFSNKEIAEKLGIKCDAINRAERFAMKELQYAVAYDARAEKQS